MKSEDQRKSSYDLEEYWSKRYLDHKIGWDLGNISAPIRDYIDQLNNKDIKILIPGAGNGYEAEYLYRSGFKQTYIIDISKLPLQNFKQRVSDFPNEQIIQGDFFQLEGQFDLIFEQTFFCSFPPIDNNREKYIDKMYALLKPKGKLVGLWFNFPFKGDLTKRPFGCTKPEYLELFAAHFELKVFEEAYNSVPDRVGKELFGVLQKKKAIAF